MARWRSTWPSPHLRLDPGDEIILPTFTIISCAAAVVRAGATPVLVDCQPDTWNINAERIAERITARTKAILVVHIYGLPVNIGPILSLARRHGLRVIEDAAEMHGQTCNDLPCGSFGDISTFSFYANKHVTTGEGGLVLTNDDLLAERCRALRNLGLQSRKRYVHDELGWNFRLSNLQAAVGLAQLERLDEFVARKGEWATFTRSSSGTWSAFSCRDRIQAMRTTFTGCSAWCLQMKYHSTRKRQCDAWRAGASARAPFLADARAAGAQKRSDCLQMIDIKMPNDLPDAVSIYRAGSH